MLVLTQTGPVNMILETVEMSDCKTRRSLTKFTPLINDTNGLHHREQWNYASVIGVLIYPSLDTHPEIKFVLHQCSWFSHVSRASHKEAIKHICQYLQGFKGNGLTFHPNNSLEIYLYVDAFFALLRNYEDNQDPVCVNP